MLMIDGRYKFNCQIIYNEDENACERINSLPTQLPTGKLETIRQLLCVPYAVTVFGIIIVTERRYTCRPACFLYQVWRHAQTADNRRTGEKDNNVLPPLSAAEIITLEYH